ncbi:hypothetical protein MMC18_002948 [Xylographa bjoerkii]|nr:hypothetical protein [Xylographa bjoerkii]
MAGHDQREIDAIFARGLRKGISVEPARSPLPGASLELLDAIQPSLTRPYSTAHLENILQLRQNRESSQTATDAIDSNFRHYATEQHSQVTLREPSIVQQHTAFVSNSNKPEDSHGEITSSKNYSNFGEHSRFLQAGDLGQLDDASLGAMLVQQLLYKDDHAIDCTTERSSSFTQEHMILESPESMSSFEGIQSLPKVTSTENNQLSDLHAAYPRLLRDSHQQMQQMHQCRAPIKTQNVAMIVHPACADKSAGAQNLSEPTRKAKPLTKAKIRTSQEQALQDEEDARAEREMQDMDREYHKQMETRRQNLAKIERDAEAKRSIASAADARRVFESKAAVNLGPNSKLGRNVAGSSALDPMICEENNDSGKKSKVEDTRSTRSLGRSVSQSAETALSLEVTRDTIMGKLSEHNELQSYNGNMTENRKTELSSLNCQSDAKQKLMLAAHLVRKQMAERERKQKEARLKLTAHPLRDCHVSSLVPSATQNISHDQGCSKSICVVEASGVAFDTNTAADILETPDAGGHPAEMPPLLAAEPGPAICSSAKTLLVQSPRAPSIVIDLSNPTVSESHERFMITENQTLERRIWDDESKLSPSMSTQSSSIVPESVIIIDAVTTSPNLPQSQRDINNINPQLLPYVAQTTLQKSLNPGQTSSKPESRNDFDEEDLFSEARLEILTRHNPVNRDGTFRDDEHTSDSINSPTILGKHDNDLSGSVHIEESNSLFGDSYSDTEIHGNVTERYQPQQPNEEIDIRKTVDQESKQVSKIVGQWVIVEADDNEDDANHASLEDSENLLKMQMQDIETKKRHTGTISSKNPIQQYAPNKRQKLETKARGLAGSRNEPDHRDNSKLIDLPNQSIAVEACISEKRRRTRMDTPERKVARQRAAIKHRQKKKEELQQASKRSHQSTPELMESIPKSLHAMPSGLGVHQARGKPQARGFAALNGAPATKSGKVPRQKASPGAEKIRDTSVRLSRKNMHLSYEERIDAIEYQLSAYDPRDIRDVEVLQKDQSDVEVLSIGQEGTTVAHAYESSSSSDEDEDEEQAQQRRILKHASSASAQENPCKPVAETPDSRRPTYARKGIGRKTTEPKASAIDDIHEDSSTKSESEGRGDITASDSEATEEDMLWQYFVTRKTRHSDDSDDLFLEEPCGTFLTKQEANKVANAELFGLHKHTPLQHSVTFSTDALGLLTCCYQTDSIDIELVVSRALHRKARLPKSATRIPKLVYGVYHRIIQRFHAPSVPDSYSYLHVGTFSLLDMANRAAGRAWLAHQLRELPDASYSREVEGPQLQSQMRQWLDELEDEGGFFRQHGMYTKRNHAMEVEVWVDEQEVQGPRN